MTGLTHMAVASVIYRRGGLPAPVLLAAGFGSHFFLDRIPHYELGLGVNLALGLAGGLLLLRLAVRDRDLLLPVAAVIGLLPDILMQPGISSGFKAFHDFCHFKGSPVSPLMLVTEFAVTAACLLVLFQRKERRGG
ncbi:hypothetical protein [Desulfotomaculum copahuensis]|uniref:Uncharacterized protein n=1 Tax=Desulfotomaculum copahuensis TaxID=1838280 RepID=A0A1B7LHK9_9FIRM|nr:hypothetical protein [Desulfotomaculum copahuensis]OAT85781.1 hypothetical protein A6M21_04610 [Desulfotomaculum copahuensis]